MLDTPRVRWRMVGWFLCQSFAWPSLRLPEELKALVDGQTIEPSLEARMPRELTDRAKGLKKDLLHEVGSFLEANHPVDQPKNPLAALLVKLPLSLPVALLAGRNDLRQRVAHARPCFHSSICSVRCSEKRIPSACSSYHRTSPRQSRANRGKSRKNAPIGRPFAIPIPLPLTAESHSLSASWASAKPGPWTKGADSPANRAHVSTLSSLRRGVLSLPPIRILVEMRAFTHELACRTSARLGQTAAHLFRHYTCEETGNCRHLTFRGDGPTFGPACQRTGRNFAARTTAARSFICEDFP